MSKLSLCTFMLLTTTILLTSPTEQQNESDPLLTPFIVRANNDEQALQPQPVTGQQNNAALHNTTDVIIAPQQFTTRETQCCWVATAFGGFLAISFIIGTLIQISLHQRTIAQ